MSSPIDPDGVSVGNIGYLEPESGLVPVPRYTPLPGRLMSLRTYSSHTRQPVMRRKREMMPPDKKDATYWIKREKNNEAARRSREKRRLKDLMVEDQLLALSKENAHLRAQVLNMQYSSSLCVDTGKVAFSQEHATSAASLLPPSLSLQPLQGHSPSLLQAGLWGNNPACLGGVTHESEMHRREGKIPCFSPARCIGVLNPFSQGLSGPGLLSSSEDGVVSSKSAEVKMDVQRLLSSTEDVRLSTAASAHLLSPIPAFPTTSGTLRPVSALQCQSHNWLVPQSNYSALSGAHDLTLPRSSFYLSPPAVYPGLPLHLQETRHQGLGVDAHMEGEPRSRFSGAPARMSHVGVYLSPGGR